MLVWAINTLVRMRKKLRQPYASAREHLLRFRGISSKDDSATSSPDTASAPSISRQGLPPPPNDVYVPDSVAADIQEALASNDISSSPGLERAYVAAVDALRKPLLSFASEVSKHWALALPNAEKSSASDKETPVISSPWYFWQRSRQILASGRPPVRGISQT